MWCASRNVSTFLTTIRVGMSPPRNFPQPLRPLALKRKQERFYISCKLSHKTQRWTSRHSCKSLVSTAKVKLSLAFSSSSRFLTKAKLAPLAFKSSQKSVKALENDFLKQSWSRWLNMPTRTEMDVSISRNFMMWSPKNTLKSDLSTITAPLRKLWLNWAALTCQYGCIIVRCDLKLEAMWDERGLCEHVLRKR